MSRVSSTTRASVPGSPTERRPRRCSRRSRTAPPSSSPVPGDTPHRASAAADGDVDATLALTESPSSSGLPIALVMGVLGGTVVVVVALLSRNGRRRARAASASASASEPGQGTNRAWARAPRGERGSPTTATRSRGGRRRPRRLTPGRVSTSAPRLWRGSASTRPASSVWSRRWPLPAPISRCTVPMRRLFAGSPPRSRPTGHTPSTCRRSRAAWPSPERPPTS